MNSVIRNPLSDVIATMYMYVHVAVANPINGLHTIMNFNGHNRQLRNDMFSPVSCYFDNLLHIIYL